MIWNSKSMAVFFLKNYRKSSAFKYIIILFFFLGLLMSVLSIFFLKSIVSEFVPSSIKIIHYPKQILEDIYNFAWASIAIYLPVLAVAFFASTSISSDLESKNIYQFMTMPISKEEYLFSKILSSFVASIISVLVFIAMQFITYLLIFRSFPPLAFLNYVTVMILIIFTDTIAAMVFSSVIKKGDYGPLGFILFFLLITNVISLLISSMSGLNDSFIITNAQRLAYLVFLNVEPYFMVYTGSLSSISFNSELLLIYIQIAYTVAFLFILYSVFMRRGEVR
jgi:ABC-type transport system involved in multi-copper enzyme maturation permease subunit